MSLTILLQNDFKEAMKAKNQVALRAHRAIKSAILLAKTDVGASAEISDEDIIKIIQKLVKQREDSIKIFNEQNRMDLAEGEQEELDILSTYLSKQLTDSELNEIVKTAINETGASSKADMGKVMSAVIAKAGGRADGKRISQQVAQLLK